MDEVRSEQVSVRQRVFLPSLIESDLSHGCRVTLVHDTTELIGYETFTSKKYYLNRQDGFLSGI